MGGKTTTTTMFGITAVLLTIGVGAWAQNLNMTGQLTASGTGTHSFMGNLGVGTAAPGARLDVGSATADTIRSYGGFVGNAAANIGGTGAAAYFPNGAWMNGGTNWIYGGIYTNGSINDTSSRMVLNPAGSSWLNGGNVGIGTTTPTSKLQVAGLITADNANAAPILSTQPASRYGYPAGAQWYLTGESLTFTVPAGPSRNYRIVMRQMVMNGSNGGAVFALSASNSSPGVNLFMPYVPLLAGAWATANAEKIVTLAPGTYTYYVWVNQYTGAITGPSVANASNDTRMYCDLFAQAI